MPSRVLLAGSDYMLQQMANTLDAGQIHTASVNDGYEALCLLNETTPDLLIAEVSLPHKDGYALCRYVRQEPEFQSLPVILLDREFNAFNQRRALSVGADVYLSQPLTPDELSEAVHRLLENKEETGDDVTDEAWSAAQVATRPQPAAPVDDEPTQPDFWDGAALPPPLLPQRRPNRLSFVAVGIAAVLIGISLLMLLRTTRPALAPDEPSSLDKSNGALATAGQPYVAAPVTEAQAEAQAGPVASAPSPEAATPSESDAATPTDTGGAISNDPQKVEAQPDEPRASSAPARTVAPAGGERQPSATTVSPRAGRPARRTNHWRRGGEEMVASGEHFGSGAKHFSKGSARAALWAGRKASGGVKRIGSAIKHIF